MQAVVFGPRHLLSHYYVGDPWQVSVGRLGIIINLTVRIVLQKAVQRELQTIQIDTLIDQLTVTQHAYAAAQQNGSIIELAAALDQIDETQASKLLI